MKSLYFISTGWIPKLGVQWNHLMVTNRLPGDLHSSCHSESTWGHEFVFLMDSQLITFVSPVLGTFYKPGCHRYSSAASHCASSVYVEDHGVLHRVTWFSWHRTLESCQSKPEFSRRKTYTGPQSRELSYFASWSQGHYTLLSHYYSR